MNKRTCILTRQVYDKSSLIRFVACATGQIVADLKYNLPGRGVYILAKKSLVKKAIEKSILQSYFKNKLHKELTINPNIAEDIEQYLVENFRRNIINIKLQKASQAKNILIKLEKLHIYRE